MLQLSESEIHALAVAYAQAKLIESQSRSVYKKYSDEEYLAFLTDYQRGIVNFSRLLKSVPDITFD